MTLGIAVFKLEPDNSLQWLFVSNPFFPTSDHFWFLCVLAAVKTDIVELLEISK